MLNEYIYSCYNTDSEAFKEMVAIIGPAMFREKFDGTQLHHIVPVKWFVENAEGFPDDMPKCAVAAAIRAWDEHPANSPSNLVYLTIPEHQRVHGLAKECSVVDGEPEVVAAIKNARSKVRIQRLDPDTMEVLQEYDNPTAAMNWVREQGLSSSRYTTGIYDASRHGIVKFEYRWARA